MKPRILTQGHFDGFCLLYAILNTYKTLLKPDQTAYNFVLDAANSNKWCKIVSNTPSLHQFASGKGSDFSISTDKLDGEIKSSFIKTCFKLLTEKTRNTISVKTLGFEEILSVDFSKSAIILCLKEKSVLEHGSAGDHWVAIIENDPKSKKLNIACSYTPHKHGYKENTGSFHRYYNNSLPYSEVKKNRIWVNSIHLVTNENANNKLTSWQLVSLLLGFSRCLHDSINTRNMG